MSDEPYPLGFEEPSVAFVSASQSARVFTEQWAGSYLFCPNCGDIPLGKYPNNSPVADLFCRTCGEDYELKAKKGRHGPAVPDGAYATMCARLDSSTNPNLVLMNYDLARYRVTDLFVVPKQFFVRSIIKERPPLAPTARRAGWVGCNILTGEVPASGKVFVVREGERMSKVEVRTQWDRIKFLRGQSAAARGWLIDVLKCVEDIGLPSFTLDDVYAHEARLQTIYPGNNNVRPKIRQQLQVLRDRGLLEFVGRGRYRLTAIQ